MAKYCDDLYADTLNALIGDIYYAEGVSFDAKIARMRKLTEVIVRRLTGYSPRSALTLGDYRTRDALNSKGMSERFLHDALKSINREGSKSTHSKRTQLPAEEEFERVSAAVTVLYSYLFFDFFKRFGFGTNDGITTAFSKLPPYLRFSVLKELVFSDCFNFIVLDKLSLASIKALGADGAADWIESERERLSAIDVPFESSDAARALDSLSTLGADGLLAYSQLLQDMRGSAYDYLIRKIPERRAIENRPPALRYDTFEEAKAVYLEHGTVEGESEDVKEFNNLMRFVFQGRKVEEEREFERCVNELTAGLRTLRSYFDSLKGDDEIGRDVMADLEAARDEIGTILDRMR